MTVFPGFGGQSFIAEVLPKVHQVPRAAIGAGSALDVEVDGGIDEETVVEAVRSGANVLVAGSAVFGRAHPLARRGHPAGGCRRHGGRSVVSGTMGTGDPRSLVGADVAAGADAGWPGRWRWRARRGAVPPQPVGGARW